MKIKRPVGTTKRSSPTRPTADPGTLRGNSNQDVTGPGWIPHPQPLLPRQEEFLMNKILILVAVCVFLLATHVQAADAPAGEALSEDYQLAVTGRKVPVYACRVFAVPLNQVWPGYQRPLDQTELAAFACWDMSGPVAVEVRCRRAPKSVVVRPASFGIVPKLDGDRIAFTLDRPRPVVVEVDGTHHALHLFASPVIGNNSIRFEKTWLGRGCLESSGIRFFG